MWSCRYPHENKAIQIMAEWLMWSCFLCKREDAVVRVIPNLKFGISQEEKAEFHILIMAQYIRLQTEKDQIKGSLHYHWRGR